jgi:hypothetical protein
MRETKLSKKVLNRQGSYIGEYSESYYTRKQRLLIESEYENYRKTKLRIIDYLHFEIDVSNYKTYTIQSQFDDYIKEKYYNKIKYYTMNDINFENDTDIYEWFCNWYDENREYNDYGKYCIIGRPNLYFYKNIIMINITKVSSLGKCNIICYYYDDGKIKYDICNNTAKVNIRTNFDDLKINIKNNNHYLNDYYDNNYVFHCRACSQCMRMIINCMNNNYLSSFPYKMKESIILTYIEKIISKHITDNNTSNILSLQILKYLYK